MALLVDTSVWSLAYRRDTPPGWREVAVLIDALRSGKPVVTTGMVLLELLRGFVPDRVRSVILDEVGRLPFLDPVRADFVAAADLSNTCWRSGVQLPSTDALIAQLAIAGDHTLLTTDDDFRHAARHIPLRVWTP